ncbi:MAG TPA: lysophospholipid acyltransferase family protein [Candidatus Hydrogenedentes bacterium]|nr:lysophospholipid acyltransferase family protein [Candidatus Hydrogenedentota bacterium]
MAGETKQTTLRAHYSPFMIWLGRTMLRILGYEWVGGRPEDLKAVITAAPHTSNWDYFYTMLFSFAIDVPIAVLIKKDWFFWPVGVFLRWLGGVPVDRSQHSNLVDEMIAAFNQRERMFMVITPEGTRKKAKYWKTGFYFVAQGAGVPILPAFMDYVNKRGGFGPIIPVTGDLEADFVKIQAFYKKQMDVTFILKPKEDGPREAPKTE